MLRPGRSLLAVEDAFTKIMSLASAVDECEEVKLCEAMHRVAAAAIFAGVSLPPFDRSAVDGFGIAEADIAKARPFSLELSGRLTASGGQRPVETLRAGRAVRLATGAPVPAGVCAIIMEEHCEIRGPVVVVSQGVQAGANIRRGGEDVGQGDALVAAGTLIDARHIAVMAAAGATRISVKRKVRVSVLSIGDEIQDGGSPLEFGMVYDSNRPMLAALLVERFVDFRDLGFHGDSSTGLAKVFCLAAESSDVIISSGAAAGSDTDHVLEAIQLAGGKAESCHLALKPGKPIIIGSLRGAVILGLPGNPVAALVSFLLFARALIFARAGTRGGTVYLESAVAGEKMVHRSGQQEFVPVDIVGVDAAGRHRIVKLGRGGSASLRPLIMAKGMAQLPSSRGDIEPEEPIGFLRFTNTTF